MRSKHSFHFSPTVSMPHPSVAQDGACCEQVISAKSKKTCPFFEWLYAIRRAFLQAVDISGIKERYISHSHFLAAAHRLEAKLLVTVAGT